MSDSASNLSPAPGSRPSPPIYLPSQVAAGAEVLGRFRLLRELGRGGFGVVWHAHDNELGLDVALKFLPDLVARDPESIEDLKREIRRGLKLTHPGIVRVHNFLRDEQLAAIAMELIEGDTLRGRKRAAPGGCLDVVDMLPWAGQLCDILTYVHEVARLVHRDLKPGNVMLTNAGEIKVADFGIASSLSDSLTRITNSPASGGTLAYMSPQQARGEPPAVTDDIYALGATFYELLTGKPPFFRGDVVLQACEIVPPPMAQRRQEFGVQGKEPIPSHWETAVAACLAKAPAARPQTVRELRQMLLEPCAVTISSAPAPRAELPALGALPPPLPQTASRAFQTEHRSTAPTPPVPPPLSVAPPPLPLPQASRRRVPLWPMIGVGGVLVLVFCGWLGWHLAEPEKPVEAVGSHSRPVIPAPATADADSLYRDGLAFENGTKGSINAAQAAVYYQRASDLGHVPATGRLARLYNYGFGVRRDEKRALTLAEKAADQGDPLAANLAAVLLREQRQEGPELARAVAYLERAAQGGSALAALNLADHLRTGRGVAKDEARAEDLDRRAFAQWQADAAAGNPEAHFWLGFCHEGGRGTPLDLQAAVRAYEAGAKAGHPRAMQALASCYARGAGTAKNEAEAIAYYQRAVDAGWLDATLAFAAQFINGDLTKNPQRAKKLYEQAILSGSSDALYRLGELLYEGDLSVRDEARAVSLFRQAADAGSTDGWWRLGIAYENGRGVAADPAEAFRCYQRAAERDDRVGLYYVGRALRVGRGTSHDPAKARTYLEKSASAGLWAAMNDLGEMMHEGEGGPKDVKRAAKLFAQAANGGYPAAEFHYGYSCENGDGVDQSYPQAVYWYGKAAGHGLAAAQANLGVLYLFGRGVVKDAPHAIELFRSAASAGNPWAQAQLGWCYEAGNGLPQDSQQAFTWFERAAQHGQPAARLQTGWYLHNGTGCVRDYVAARSWYEKAAGQGVARAINNLGVLYEGGLGIKANRTKAIEYYRRAAAAGDDLAPQNLRRLGGR